MTEPVQKLGRYQVQSLLATGGMAEIYRARGPAGEEAVVKVITRERAEDQKFIQMFLDEARLVAGLNHPNIARLLEVGKEGQVYFLAMEFVHGETVRAVLEVSARARQPIPPGIALAIVARVAHALHHAHDRKGLSGTQLEIVHRDVTPANVMLGYDGVVKLLDFGIARAKGRAQETQSGTVKGKFAYMAPEQCKGKPVDRRADVFSLGIVLYELTTLRRAFRGESDYETLQKIVTLDIAPPSKVVPGYPPALEAIVQRAMALDPDARFQTAIEMATALEAVAVGLGGLASPAALAAFMAERFIAGAAGPASDDAGDPGDDPSMVIEAGTVGDTPSKMAGAAKVRTTPTPPPSAALTPAPDGLGEDDPGATYRMAPSPARAAPSDEPTFAVTGWEGGEKPSDSDAAAKKTVLGVGPGRLRQLTEQVTPLPPPVAHVALPEPPPPYRGPWWALPVAVVSIVVVAAGIAALILMT